MKKYVALNIEGTNAKSKNVNSINLKGKSNFFNADGGSLESLKQDVSDWNDKISKLTDEFNKQKLIVANHPIPTPRRTWLNSCNKNGSDPKVYSDGYVHCSPTAGFTNYGDKATKGEYSAQETLQTAYELELNNAKASVVDLEKQIADANEKLKQATESLSKASETDPTLLAVKQEGQIATTKIASAIKTKKTLVIFALSFVGLVGAIFVLAPLFKKRESVA